MEIVLHNEMEREEKYRARDMEKDGAGGGSVEK